MDPRNKFEWFKILSDFNVGQIYYYDPIQYSLSPDGHLVMPHLEIISVDRGDADGVGQKKVLFHFCTEDFRCLRCKFGQGT